MNDLPPLQPDRAYFVEEVAVYVRVSRRTIERLRSHNNFPIPELPSLDRRPRWSGRDIQEYLERRQSVVPRRFRRSA